MEKELISNSATETKELGRKIGLLCNTGMCILCIGDLGAGKTTFTQGLAIGLDITKTVSSPTYTILKVYHGRLPLYHMDAYRLEGLHQELGFEEMIEGDGVCVIEWPDYMKDHLPTEYLSITLTNLEEDQRKINLTAVGERYERLLKEIL